MTPDQQRAALLYMLRKWRSEQAQAIQGVRLIERLSVKGGIYLIFHPREVLHAVSLGVRTMIRLGWCIEQMVCLLVVADLDMWEPEAQAGTDKDEEH